MAIIWKTLKSNDIEISLFYLSQKKFLIKQKCAILHSMCNQPEVNNIFLISVEILLNFLLINKICQQQLFNLSFSVYTRLLVLTMTYKNQQVIFQITQTLTLIFYFTFFSSTRFEATVRLDEINEETKLTGTISRISTYTKGCVKDSYVEKYCFCDLI